MMHSVIAQHIESLDWQQEPRNLYAPIGYALASGGKRIRPQLVIMGAELFGGTLQAALPVATAVEIFHNFTLLHDDIMDKADTRRGRATVHKMWSENAAILSGDAMMIKAYEQLQGVPAQKMPQIFALFNKMALQICEGQQYDMDFENSMKVSLDDYFTMIRLKTAVLLAYSLKMGALLADAPADDAEHLFQFGIGIGLAFQLRDDYLDVYGDPKTFGKNIGGDILCGKKTFLLLTALEHANATQKERIEQLLADSTLPAAKKIEQMTALYNELQLPDKCQKAMSHYYDFAIEQLDAIAHAKTTTEPLRKLAQQLMGRTD